MRLTSTCTHRAARAACDAACLNQVAGIEYQSLIVKFRKNRACAAASAGWFVEAKPTQVSQQGRIPMRQRSGPERVGVLAWWANIQMVRDRDELVPILEAEFIHAVLL